MNDSTRFLAAAMEIGTLREGEADALSDAAFAFADHGIEFRLPWNGDLDDLEGERYCALVRACRAYHLALTDAQLQAERDQAIAQFEATAAAQGWRRTDGQGSK